MINDLKTEFILCAFVNINISYISGNVEWLKN